MESSFLERFQTIHFEDISEKLELIQEEIRSGDDWDAAGAGKNFPAGEILSRFVVWLNWTDLVEFV